MTDPDDHAMKHEQELVEIDGQKFLADSEMIPLLKALNEAGLKTRTHCSGCEKGTPWVVIKTDNIEIIQVRNYEGCKEVLIEWKHEFKLGPRKDSR
jgi:hypothetical protein